MRQLLLILFLFCGSFAKAQTPMHWLTAKKIVAPLFDAFPSGQWGVSFRKLRQGYLGSCVRVRRMSDNVEQDIGFDKNFCDTVALKTFLGSNAGRTVTWYDQSGNGLNFNTVDTAHQPYMVFSSGKLIYNYVGKLSMSSVPENATNTTTNIYYLRNTFTGASSASTFVVLNSPSLLPGAAVYPYGYPAPNSIGCIYSLEPNSSYYMLGGSSGNSYAAVGTPTTYLNGNSRTITTRQQVIDSISVPSSFAQVLFTGLNLNMSTWNNVSLAREGAASTFKPSIYYTEYIMYASDQTSNRLGIEANINSYYNIY